MSGDTTLRLEAGKARRPLDTGCTTKFTLLTQAIVFHNLCRDQHEITALPLDCARFWQFAHDLLRRHKKRKFHHYNSDCRLTIFGRACTTIFADFMPASHTIHNRFHAVWIGNTFSRCSSSFFIGRRHAASLSVSFCRLQSSEMRFADSPLDNTVRIAMTIHTKIQNQIFTRLSLAASATALRVVATIQELSTHWWPKECSFQKRGHSPRIDHFRSTVSIFAQGTARAVFCSVVTCLIFPWTLHLL